MQRKPKRKNTYLLRVADDLLHRRRNTKKINFRDKAGENKNSRKQGKKARKSYSRRP